MINLFGSRTFEINNKPGITAPALPIQASPIAQQAIEHPLLRPGPDKHLAQLGATIFSEAGNDPNEMRAIASVIINRAREKNTNYSNIVKAPNQFQGTKNPQYTLYFARNKDYPSQQKYQQVQQVLDEIQNGKFQDLTRGANYFAQTPKSRYGITTGRYGKHYFYKGKSNYPI